MLAELARASSWDKEIQVGCSRNQAIDWDNLQVTCTCTHERNHRCCCSMPNACLLQALARTLTTTLE